MRISDIRLGLREQLSEDDIGGVEHIIDGFDTFVTLGYNKGLDELVEYAEQNGFTEQLKKVLERLSK